MAAVDSIIEVMREVVMTPNPALVTREEFLKLEERVDRILLMMDELEERLGDAAEAKADTRLPRDSEIKTPAHFYTPPPRRP